MIPYIGSSERPEVLFTTDRIRFAPTFYTCSLSFVRYFGSRVGLDVLVSLFAYAPAEMNARLDTLSGKQIAEWRTEWLQLLKLSDERQRLQSLDALSRLQIEEAAPDRQAYRFGPVAGAESFCVVVASRGHARRQVSGPTGARQDARQHFGVAHFAPYTHTPVTTTRPDTSTDAAAFSLSRSR